MKAAVRVQTMPSGRKAWLLLILTDPETVAWRINQQVPTLKASQARTAVACVAAEREGPGAEGEPPAPLAGAPAPRASQRAGQP